MATTTATAAALAHSAAHDTPSFPVGGLLSSSPSCGGKRRSDESSFDCQSLQFSLKRVRLSGCCPGELRLQHDLRSLLSSQGWTQVAKHRWQLDDAASNALALYDTPPPLTASSRSLYGRAGPPRSVTLEQGVARDPMRLTLMIARTARVLLHIPRTYPHRPPIVGRIDYADDDVGLNRPRQIIVNSASPCGVVATSPPVSPSIVVFNQWSPIMRLGDLIAFIVDVVRTSSGNRTLPPPSGAAPLFDFIEEHKTEDLPMNDFEVPQDASASLGLHSSRFDAGYGRYSVPIASVPAGTDRRDPSDASSFNTMDFSC